MKQIKQELVSADKSETKSSKKTGAQKRKQADIKSSTKKSKVSDTDSDADAKQKSKTKSSVKVVVDSGNEETEPKKKCKNSHRTDTKKQTVSSGGKSQSA